MQTTALVPDSFRIPREVIEFACTQYADRTALIAPGWRLSYAQLQARTWQLARALTDLGLRKGDVCYVQLASGGDIVQASLAAMSTGIILIGIPRRPSPEVLDFFCHAVRPAAFLHEAEGEADADLLVQRVPGLAHCRYDLLPRGPDAVAEPPPLAPLEPDDIGLIGFSSGTTGAPKVLQASYGTYLTGVRLIVKHVLPAQQINGPMVMLVAIPVSGAGSGVLLPTWFRGGTLVVPAACSADHILPLIAQHRATNLFISPSLLIDLLDHPQLDHADLSSLRSILYGTELMPAAKLEEALRRFGPILQQGYGSAEVLPPVTLLQPGEHMRGNRPAPRAVLESVGAPVPEVQVTIADDDDAPLPQGAVGHVLIRSPTQFKGYVNQPDANDKILRNGWLHIGDIGYLDEDGRLHVLGRAPDLIRRNGHLTYPRRVEEALHDHPAVKETAYVQVGEQALMAASVRHNWRWRLKDETLAQGMLEFMSARVPVTDLPDGVRLLEELPRSPLGKVLRREVRQMLSSEDAPA